jgi:hypothetical protein
MNNTQCETGEQLFDRIFSSSSITTNNNEKICEQKRSNPLKLDTKIFSNEFECGDLYEISGRPGSAKSELMLHLIASFLLPGKWDIEQLKIQIDLSKWSFYPDLTNNQQKSKIILIDTDFKFCILKFFSILEYRIKNSIKLQQQTGGDPLVSKISRSALESFIKSCLTNLLVYKCSTNEQLLLTLASCEYCIKQEQQARIQNNQNIKPFFMPIFIDSINSNFEFIDPLLLNSDDHTEKYTVSLVNRILAKYKKNLCVIATRVEYDPTTNKYDTSAYTCPKWQKIVTKQIKMVKLTNGDFQLTNSKGEDYFFTIGNLGLAFKDV